jgi:hypothetical protein
LKLDLASAAFAVDPTILVQHNDQVQESRVPLVAKLRNVLFSWRSCEWYLVGNPAKNSRGQAFVMQLHLEHTLLLDVYRDF